MPKWPFKWPFKESRATGKALCRIEEARKNGARNLELSGLKLSTLPEAVQSLERLKKLFLHGNPGLGLPDEVLGPTLEKVFGPQKRSLKPSREIIDYYFATRGAKGRGAARGEADRSRTRRSREDFAHQAA